MGANGRRVPIGWFVSAMVVGAIAVATVVEAKPQPRWHVVQSMPNDGGGVTYGFSDVSCPSPKWCMGVANAVDRAIAAVWNGESWSLTSPPPTMSEFGPDKGGDLRSVSCVSPSLCVAGGSQVVQGEVRALVDYWDGKDWRAVPVPGGPWDLAQVYGVACRNGLMMKAPLCALSVSSRLPELTSCIASIIWIVDVAGEWTPVLGPPQCGTGMALGPVDCNEHRLLVETDPPKISDVFRCYFGGNSRDSGILPQEGASIFEVEIVPDGELGVGLDVNVIQNHKLWSNGFVNDVACPDHRPSSTAPLQVEPCLAVGERMMPLPDGSSIPSAARIGTTFSGVELLTPPRRGNSHFDAVSCNRDHLGLDPGSKAPPLVCTAVGATELEVDGAASARMLVESFKVDDGRWTIAKTPTIAARLSGISCQATEASRSCVAVGEDIKGKNSILNLLATNSNVPLSVASTTLPPAFRSTPPLLLFPYSWQLEASGGAEPYRWSTRYILPAGLRLTSDGVLKGVVGQGIEAPADYPFEVTVRDADGNQASAVLTLKVLP